MTRFLPDMLNRPWIPLGNIIQDDKGRFIAACQFPEYAVYIVGLHNSHREYPVEERKEEDVS